MPNLQTDLDYILQDGDRTIFYPTNMLPTQVCFELNLTNQMRRTVRADEDLNLYDLYDQKSIP